VLTPPRRPDASALVDAVLTTGWSPAPPTWSTCSTCARPGGEGPSSGRRGLGGPAGGLVAGPLGAALAVLPADLASG
jgi:hypothetical protein